MSSSYIIRGGDEGRARLSVLSKAMAPFTGALLDRVGDWTGLSVLDAGCGGGDVSRELAARVGPRGRVVGVDGDAAKIEAAREAAAGIGQLSFRTGDAMAAGPGDPFDVIYARFLLSHLTDPVGALATFQARLKPGGLLVVEDVDFVGHFSDPHLPALDRYVGWYREAAFRRGANAIIGRELPRLARGAGFELMHTGVVSPAALEGPIKQITPLTLAMIADSVVEARLTTRGEVHETLAQLQAAADDPAVFMGMPRVGQVIARVP
jgi:ubiquinone/menaquinone biosynthesis C-methylase UbiE